MNNQMDKVAELLDIKIGEWFMIEGIDHKHKLSNTELVYLDDNNNEIYANYTFMNLITGKCKIVEKFKPTRGKRYYIPFFDNEKSDSPIWVDDNQDKFLLEHELICETREEAIAMTDKLLEYIKELRKGE